MNEIEKEKMLQFLNFIGKNGISPNDIFFIDENIFNLASYFNRNMKIRISKEQREALKMEKKVQLN